MHSTRSLGRNKVIRVVTARNQSQVATRSISQVSQQPATCNSRPSRRTAAAALGQNHKMAAGRMGQLLAAGTGRRQNPVAVVRSACLTLTGLRCLAVCETARCLFVFLIEKRPLIVFHSIISLVFHSLINTCGSTMASSRLEKIGTIYSRVTGLLRAGAMKYEDRPIWYEVYESFPPKNEPPSLVNTPLPQILYPEDVVRAKFQKLAAANDTVNLVVKNSQTKCQKFMAVYQDLEAMHPNSSPDELFQEALDKLQSQFLPSDGNNIVPKSQPKISLASSFKDAQILSSEQGQLSKKIDIADVMKED